MTTITLDSLNTGTEADFTAALGDIFEHSPWVADLAAKRRPFATIKDLHNAMMAALRAAPAETRLALVKAHPDLAGKAARAGAPRLLRQGGERRHKKQNRQQLANRHGAPLPHATPSFRHRSSRGLAGRDLPACRAFLAEGTIRGVASSKPVDL